MDYVNYFDSPLGRLTLASDGTNLTGLWFWKQRYYASTLDSKHIEKDLPIFSRAKGWLDLYFEGQCPDLIVDISFKGTVFQEKVWKELLKIPYGQTATYGEIAKRIAKEQGLSKMSAQAVGGAVGHNPIAIIIPCHRIIGLGGKLNGYSGGLDRKEKLLQLERGNSLIAGAI